MHNTIPTPTPTAAELAQIAKLYADTAQNDDERNWYLMDYFAFAEIAKHSNTPHPYPKA